MTEIAIAYVVSPILVVLILTYPYWYKLLDTAKDFERTANKAYGETLAKYHGKGVKPLGWYIDEHGTLRGRWPPPPDREDP